MISESELKKERDYLRTVLYILEKEIAKREGEVSSLDQDMRKEMRYIWDNGVADPSELHGIYESVKQMARGSNSNEHTLKTYRKMFKSAYFARIDFNDGEETLPIYVGIATLKDGGSFYVYDWRAPISGMFYDFTLGDAFYTLPDGSEIHGKITLKRQYKLEGDKIIEVFDTDMQILDEVLSGMLSQEGSTKMKNIVATIQQEQNKVIRKENVDIFIVQGPAGSGKTSVALHRTAYLLYAQKGNITNSNVLIISPNDIFTDYISDVLPQIGEENVYQTTYMELVKAFIKEFKIKSSMDNVYEEIYLNENATKKSDYFNSIRFKFWPGYVKILEQLISENKEQLLCIKDIEVDGNQVISKDALVKFAEDFEIEGLPIVEQLRRINEKVKSYADVKFFKQSKLKLKLAKMLQLNVNSIKTKPLYMELYSNLDKFTSRVQEVYNELGTPKKERLTIKELKGVFEYTSAQLSKAIMPYEDVTPYLYLKTRVVGMPVQENIKHVLIDECQDYSLTQYNVAAQAFKHAQITLLGDLNQSIMPYANHENYEAIINLFKRDRISPKVDMKYLTKTYRSTCEINGFARLVVGAPEFSRQQIERHGDKVAVIQDKEPSAKSKLAKDAIDLKRKFKTVAIIFKTEAECHEFQKKIAGTTVQHEFVFMMGGNNDFSDEKVMVMPIYTAKGLEFDVALVARANENNYPAEDAKLLYVACTRAMNKLNLYYDDVKSSLIGRTEV